MFLFARTVCVHSVQNYIFFPYNGHFLRKITGRQYIFMFHGLRHDKKTYLRNVFHRRSEFFIMWEVHSSDKIRIKDIAERSGVSVGTVDRVLHNRPNVSAKARKRVETVLKEINYQPNIYASALAYNKKYTFCCLLPGHDRNAYWTQIEQGLRQCILNRNDFHLSLITEYYDQFNGQSFERAARSLLEKKPDGMVIVPQDTDVTQGLCHTLQEADIPFVFLDSNIPGIRPLSFFGQDSLKSGYFAGRIFMMQAGRETGLIMLMKLMSNGRVASRQQENREVGFRQYMAEYYPDCRVVELPLQIGEENAYAAQIRAFLEQYPDIRHCITFCSRAHILGEYLLENHLRGFHLFGYDMIERNVECLKRGSIDFLIAQHPWKQGYNSVKSLFNHIVLKKAVQQYHYMPLELLTAENYIYYMTDEK